MNLWDCDLLQQWNTQVNIPAVPKTHVSGKDIIRYRSQRLPAIQAVQEHKTTSKSSEVLMALSLKWLTEKPIWAKQWPLTENKLQALEQLVQDLNILRCQLGLRILL